MSRAPDSVGDLMTKDVVTVKPDEPVRSGVRAMVERDIGSVVVVDGDETVGVFTERDVTRGILDDSGFLDRPVRDVMSSPPITADADAEVVFVFELMNARGIRRLPVVDQGRLVGIVTERDLLRWVGQVAKE
jgi:CBS domain-containing protein